MLKTLKPEDNGLASTPNIVRLINPKAITVALKRAKQPGKLARAYTLTPQAKAELKRLAAAERRRTSAHWHFRVAADGRPTCLVPTLNKPKGRHKAVPVRGHETALEAMDRCVTGWGDKDAPSHKLQWRDE